VIEGMETRDDFFQLAQANATQEMLTAIASVRATYPNGRETTNTAGLKMNATLSKAAVLVYPAPAEFPLESNMATSWVVGPV
jgi:hypothetical protein